MICPNCYYKGKPEKVVKGSILMEIALWFLFIIPGVLYSIWRLTTKQLVCPKCKNNSMIPEDTPRGQQLLIECKKYNYDTRNDSKKKTSISMINTNNINETTNIAEKKHSIILLIVGWIFIPYIMIGNLIYKKGGNIVVSILVGILVFYVWGISFVIVTQVEDSVNNQSTKTFITENQLKGSNPNTASSVSQNSKETTNTDSKNIINSTKKPTANDSAISTQNEDQESKKVATGYIEYVNKNMAYWKISGDDVIFGSYIQSEEWDSSIKNGSFILLSDEKINNNSRIIKLKYPDNSGIEMLTLDGNKLICKTLEIDESPSVYPDSIYTLK